MGDSSHGISAGSLGGGFGMGLRVGVSCISSDLSLPSSPEEDLFERSERLLRPDGGLGMDGEE